MKGPKPNEILTAAEWERKYPGYAEAVFNSLPPIDSEVVPESLKRLIPFAEEWGIPDDFLRHRCCEMASQDKGAAFKVALKGTHRDFEDWVYTEPDAPQDQETKEKERYAQRRFGRMYVAELESFGGRGIRGFADWYKEYDPESYEEWLKS